LICRKILINLIWLLCWYRCLWYWRSSSSYLWSCSTQVLGKGCNLEFSGKII